MLSVLVVDDDDIDIETVRRALVKANVRADVQVAQNGLDALEHLRHREVQPLVLLDINLPRMDGIEFLHELRRDPKLSSTPVVVLTTSDAERDRRAAHALGITGYLLKPVTPEKFLQILGALSL